MLWPRFFFIVGLVLILIGVGKGLSFLGMSYPNPAAKWWAFTIGFGGFLNGLLFIGLGLILDRLEKLLPKQAEAGEES